jgi:histidinol dehydrogenase
MIPLYKNSELTGETREKLFRRAQADIDAIYDDVKYWVQKVKNEGDAAIVEYIQKFDDPNFTADQIRVSKEEIKAAYDKVDPEVLVQMKKQIRISKNFHKEQADKIFAERSWEVEYIPGVRTGAKKTPLDSAGCYVPAGKAPLPTVSQILTVAAKAAQVPRVAVFFPPTGNYPEILVAADIAGADEVYRVGGIAAIAAMAYGTESIKAVEKISGPGSPWVQAAKLQVFGQVGIDMLAGPSEGLIMADKDANPDWVAADVIARCEHGPDSCMPVVTDSPELAEQILASLEKLTPSRKRQEFIQAAFKNGYNGIVIVENLEEMIDFANEYAAEHLEIQTQNAEEVSLKIRNAGSIFIGEFAPVPVGDYASGTNHSLPTARAVKFSSPVGVETFIKSVEFQILNQEGIKALEPIVTAISDIEGLDAHGEAVRMRCR